MNCQRCGDVNPPGAAFCLNCGGRFDVAANTPVPPSGAKKGMAIAALFIGIMNLFLFGLFGVGAITGIIVGFIALSKIRKAPMEYGGKGMATAGLTMSGLSVILSFVAIIAAVSIPAILQKRTIAKETVVLMDIKTLVQAETSYNVNNGRYGTIKQLVESQDLAEYWSNELVNTYRFRVNADDSAFEIFATPSRYGPDGRRSFYTSSLNLDKEIPVIHGADKGGAEASSHDPILDY
jgi:hypothetical protein